MLHFRPAVRPLEDRYLPATLVVNTAYDGFRSPDDRLDLREAIFAIAIGGNPSWFTAAERAQMSGPFGIGDTIRFDAALTGQAITLTQWDSADLSSGLVVNRDVTLDARDAPGLTVRQDAIVPIRLFRVSAGTLTVRNLTLADGQSGSVSIPPVLGGIDSGGGAILIDGGAVVAENVTFRDNSAGYGTASDRGFGGAIFNNGGSLTVRNSTFSGNAALAGTPDAPAPLGGGGAIGIFNGATVLENVTIWGNVVTNPATAGIYALSNGLAPFPTLSVTNSVLESAAVASFTGSAFTFSGGSNLVRTSTGLPAGLISSSADPLLAPLAFNGGLTQTMYPKGGSPVLNAGDSATAANPFDQRGKARVSGSAVDLGAVEVQASVFAVGVGAGSSQPVRVYNPDGTQKLSIAAYAAGYTGGVFVGTGDVNQDGTADIVTSTGKGGSANIRLFNGTNGTLLQSFFAYPEAFTGGVNVALGDVNFDGVADIICGVGVGGGPNVRILDGRAVAAGKFSLTPVSAGGMLIASFFAYDAGFTGGVRVTVADVNNDGFADVICGVGSGGGPNVRVFDGKQVVQNNFSLAPVNAGGMLINSFFALPSTFTGGLFLAAGDMNGDGLVDIVNGVESGGGPNVRAYTANNLASVSSFFAYDQNQTGGVRVAAADMNGDGYTDYITGSGPGSTGQVKVISGKDATTNLLAAFTPFGGLVNGGGVNVG